MLNTAQIIIPKTDNDGSDNSDVIERTITDLCSLYGGATVWDANGFWTNEAGRLYKDEVSVIQSAMTKSRKNRDALRNLAQAILTDTDQEAVYVSHADGAVEIIEREEG